MTIGDRIKYFRESNNMTQDDLATKVKTTKQTIYKYENNIITNIPSDKIEMIANALEVTPVILMGWDRDFTRVEQEIYKNSARNKMANSSSTDDKCNAKLQEYLSLYARSLNASKDRNDLFHPDFEMYVSMMLNQTCQKDSMPSDVYEILVEKYGKSDGIENGKSYWYPKDSYDTHTIAAHHEGEDWTKEELDEIEEFKKFIRSKRKKNN